MVAGREKWPPSREQSAPLDQRENPALIKGQAPDPKSINCIKNPVFRGRRCGVDTTGRRRDVVDQKSPLHLRSLTARHSKPAPAGFKFLEGERRGAKSEGADFLLGAACTEQKLAKTSMLETGKWEQRIEKEEMQRKKKKAEVRSQETKRLDCRSKVAPSRRFYDPLTRGEYSEEGGRERGEKRGTTGWQLEVPDRK